MYNIIRGDDIMEKNKINLKNIDLKVTYEMAVRRKDRVNPLQVMMGVPTSRAELELLKRKCVIYVQGEMKKYEDKFDGEFKILVMKRYNNIIDAIRGLIDYRRIYTEIERFEIFLNVLYCYVLEMKEE